MRVRRQDSQMAPLVVPSIGMPHSQQRMVALEDVSTGSGAISVAIVGVVAVADDRIGLGNRKRN